MTAQAVRETDGAPLIDPLHVARSPAERMRGLLGRDGLAPGEGMWFPDCRLIHTIGMRFRIDLVYLNRHLRVCKVVPGLRPWRLSACLAARSVIELSFGAAQTLGLHPGVKLKIVE